ncbi:MAG: AbiV family abortive infection protein [Planctomycetota bacterium]
MGNNIGIDPETPLRLAEAACRNAHELEIESLILAGRESFGRATSLAILGQEECGKAIGLVCVAWGLLPRQEPDLGTFLRHHRTKQLFGWLALPEAAEFFAALWQPPFIEAFKAWVDSVQGIESEQDIGPAIRAFGVDLPRMIAPLAPELEVKGRQLRAALNRLQETVWDNGELDLLKQRGFYVDVAPGDGAISEPKQIVRTNFDEQAARLHRLLGFADDLSSHALRGEELKVFRDHVIPELVKHRGEGALRDPKQARP